MVYECERCPEARPAVYYCVAEAGGLRCLGPLPSNHATAVATAGGSGDGGGA